MVDGHLFNITSAEVILGRATSRQMTSKRLNQSTCNYLKRNIRALTSRNQQGKDHDDLLLVFNTLSAAKVTPGRSTEGHQIRHTYDTILYSRGVDPEMQGDWLFVFNSALSTVLSPNNRTSE